MEIAGYILLGLIALSLVALAVAVDFVHWIGKNTPDNDEYYKE